MESSGPQHHLAPTTTTTRISSSSDYVEYVRRLAGGGSHNWAADFQRRASPWSPRGDRALHEKLQPCEDSRSSASTTDSGPSGVVRGGTPGAASPPSTSGGSSTRSTSPLITTPFFQQAWGSALVRGAGVWSPRAVSTDDSATFFLARHNSEYRRASGVPLTEENLERHDENHFRRLHSAPPPSSTELL